MPESPTLEEVFLQIFDQNSKELKAIEPGEVISWDKDDQVANIQPLVRERNGVNRAVIYRVPVIQPTAYHDVQVGETGLLLICDRNPARWWRDNQQSNAETEAAHHPSNAIFLPGLRSKADARTIPSDTAVLERPAVAGEVHLGIQGATKAAVHEDLLSDLNTFFVNISTWASAVDAIIGLIPPADYATVVTPTITTITAKIIAGSYQSPSVKVES